MAAPAARYPWEQAEYEVGGESDSDFELSEAEQAATNMLEVFGRALLPISHIGLDSVHDLPLGNQGGSIPQADGVVCQASRAVHW